VVAVQEAMARWPAAGSEKRLMLEYAGLEKV